jgi:hypothetical protein
MENNLVSPAISENLGDKDSVSLSNRKKMALENLTKVASEIGRRFEQWDDAIERKQQVVAIQDLDFWKSMIDGAVIILREEKNEN